MPMPMFAEEPADRWPQDAEIDPIAPPAALCFEVAGYRLAVDITQVREVRAYETPSPRARLHGCVRGVINLQGAIVPIVDLHLHLVGRCGAGGPSAVVIVVERRGCIVGLMVDGVGEVMGLQPLAGEGIDYIDDPQASAHLPPSLFDVDRLLADVRLLRLDARD